MLTFHCRLCERDGVLGIQQSFSIPEVNHNVYRWPPGRVEAVEVASFEG